MDSFEKIDTERHLHRLTRRAVYERAGVNGATWVRLAKKRHEPNLRTLKKLRTALDALVAEKTGSDAGP